MRSSPLTGRIIQKQIHSESMRPFRPQPGAFRNFAGFPESGPRRSAGIRLHLFLENSGFGQSPRPIPRCGDRIRFRQCRTSRPLQCWRSGRICPRQTDEHGVGQFCTYRKPQSQRSAALAGVYRGHTRNHDLQLALRGAEQPGSEGAGNHRATRERDFLIETIERTLGDLEQGKLQFAVHETQDISGFIDR